MAHWLAHPEEGACCELYATIALIAGESGTNDPTLHLCGNYSICETLPRGVDRDKDPGWSDRCQSETTRADGYVGLLAIADPFLVIPVSRGIGAVLLLMTEVSAQRLL